MQKKVSYWRLAVGFLPALVVRSELEEAEVRTDGLASHHDIPNMDNQAYDFHFFQDENLYDMGLPIFDDPHLLLHFR